MGVNHRTTVNKDCFLTSLLFLIFPLFSTPLIIRGMIQCKRWAFVLWSCFMGLLGILYPPVGDIYRYTLDFQMYKGLDWDSFLYAISFKFDYLLSFISYIVGLVDINFDVVRFLFNFLGYYIFSIICLDIIQNNSFLRTNRKSLIYAIFIFIYFNIIAFLWRFGLASALFTYGAYKIIYKSNKSGWLFVILSVFCHVSFCVFVIGLIFNKFCRLKKWGVIVLCLCTLFIDGQSLLYLFSFLPIDFVNRFSVYIDGYYATEYIGEHSLRYQIFTFLSSSIAYIACLCYILTYNNQNRASSIVTITNTILIITCIALPFDVIRTRFLAVLLIFIKMNLLYFYDSSRRSKLYLMILFISIMIGNGMNLWSTRRQIMVGDYEKLLYCSTPQILFHTYNETWINTNVLPDGSMSRID